MNFSIYEVWQLNLNSHVIIVTVPKSPDCSVQARPLTYYNQWRTGFLSGLYTYSDIHETTLQTQLLLLLQNHKQLSFFLSPFTNWQVTSETHEPNTSDAFSGFCPLVQAARFGRSYHAALLQNEEQSGCAWIIKVVSTSMALVWHKRCRGQRADSHLGLAVLKMYEPVTAFTKRSVLSVF